MLKDAYLEMTSLSDIDLFCREYYQQTGHYMKDPSPEEIRSLLSMWGKLDHVMYEEDLNTSLNNHPSNGLGKIFSKEELFFEEGRDVNILAANRYFDMSPHSHNYFEIECIVEGTALHNPGKEQIYLKKGDIVLVPVQKKHITQPVDSSTIVDLEIRLSTFEKTFQDILSCELPISSYFKSCLYGKDSRECIILDGVLDETIMELLGLIWRENKNNTFISGKKCVHLMQTLLYHLAEVVTADHIYDVFEYQNEEIYQIRRYMLEHLDNVSLSMMADQFHRSVSVLSRYIKSRCGTGFSELLQNMRLEKAADLLLSTDQDISRIAAAVGYAGDSHFIYCFRKKFKMTPLQYRRSRSNME